MVFWYLTAVYRGRTIQKNSVVLLHNVQCTSYDLLMHYVRLFKSKQLRFKDLIIRKIDLFDFEMIFFIQVGFTFLLTYFTK